MVGRRELQGGQGIQASHSAFMGKLYAFFDSAI